MCVSTILSYSTVANSSTLTFTVLVLYLYLFHDQQYCIVRVHCICYLYSVLAFCELGVFEYEYSTLVE
jgi:hypothetical protein